MSAAITSSARPSWRQNLGHALTATVLTAVVVTPIFGLHLERAGVRTIITQHWSNVAWACLLVFIVQMLRLMIENDQRQLTLSSGDLLQDIRQRGARLAGDLLLPSGKAGDRRVPRLAEPAVDVPHRGSVQLRPGLRPR